MSDTPLTDDAEHLYISPSNDAMGDDYAEHVVSSDFARQLERDNRRMHEALAFYANRANWDSALTTLDYGEKASKALTDNEL